MDLFGGFYLVFSLYKFLKVLVGSNHRLISFSVQIYQEPAEAKKPKCLHILANKMFLIFMVS